MELVEVEIIGQAITARYGTLNTGDILRTDAAFAKHLVEDCAAAKYSSPRKAAALGAPEIKSPRKKREKPADADHQPTAPSDSPETPASATLVAPLEATSEVSVLAGSEPTETPQISL